MEGRSGGSFAGFGAGGSTALAVGEKLARVRAKWEVLKLFNWRQAWAMTQGSLNFADASTVKVFASEAMWRTADEALQVAGSQVAPIDLLVTDVVMPGRNETLAFRQQLDEKLHGASPLKSVPTFPGSATCQSASVSSRNVLSVVSALKAPRLR